MEHVAACIGVVSVWLTVRQNVWCWPVGAVMVALYAFLFWEARLYADAGLQVIYFVLQFYGWYEWRYGSASAGPLVVARTARRELLALLALGAVVGIALGAILGRYTNQDFPYLDSSIASFSLVAQYLMARKRLENWLVWIAVDVVAVGVYAAKELYSTAALYTLFLVLAALGFREWRRSVR